MNKISLGIVTVCSALAGMMLGKFLWLPQEVSVGTWFAMGINVVAVLISLSNIVNHGIVPRNAMLADWNVRHREQCGCRKSE